MQKIVVYILTKLTKTFPKKILDTSMNICFAYLDKLIVFIM